VPNDRQSPAQISASTWNTVRRDLNALLDNTDGEPGFRPPLTLLKKLDQSLLPRDIQLNVKTSQVVADYFYQFQPIIEKLGLTDQAAEYYATWVRKARTLQVKQFPNSHKTYLHLLAYFKDEYYRRQDSLTDIFLKSVRTLLNKAYKVLREKEADGKIIRNKAIKLLTQAHMSSRELIDHIKDAVKSQDATHHEKIHKIEELLSDYESQHSAVDNIRLNQHMAMLEDLADDKHYFTLLESLSVKLQNRVAGILKFLEFDAASSDPVILDAINHFKHTDGTIGQSAPLEFLSDAEIIQVEGSGALRTSLYKYLLFVHTMDKIKSGQLNLKYSYRYRAIQDYLIDINTWRKNKQEILESAGLTKFAVVKSVLLELKDRLNDKYQTVNDRYQSDENPYLTVGKDGDFKIRTPKTEYSQEGFIGNTLAENGFVHILDILREINNVSAFVRHFKHSSTKHSKMKISPEMVYAGVMGIGCNIGIRKIANISVGIKENSLANAVNWCFELKHIEAASRSIKAVIDKLALANLYKEDPSILHTSSDGRKVGVAVDSLHANYSFKYFGKDKGVTMYTFIDERQCLFHSTVISASDREAAFVIDGLLLNDVPEQVIHHVDSHGFSEAVAAATHFIDVGFATRLKNIGGLRLYGFSARSTYQKKGYDILPSRAINQELIIK